MKTKIILATIILLAASKLYAAPPAEEGKTIFPVNTQTDYLSLVLSNKGLLVSSLALIAILVAALYFLLKVKFASSKTP